MQDWTMLSSIYIVHVHELVVIKCTFTCHKVYMYVHVLVVIITVVYS